MSYRFTCEYSDDLYVDVAPHNWKPMANKLWICAITSTSLGFPLWYFFYAVVTR